jgi:N-acetyl-gamma-glutamyl-phosphate reductase
VEQRVSAAELQGCLERAYGGERFVRVPTQRLPEVVAVATSNYAEVGVAVGESAGGQRQVAVVSALDNLVKGGAGQAIQNLNLMFGVEESLTLTDPGSFP